MLRLWPLSMLIWVHTYTHIYIYKPLQIYARVHERMLQDSYIYVCMCVLSCVNGSWQFSLHTFTSGSPRRPAARLFQLFYLHYLKCVVKAFMRWRCCLIVATKIKNKIKMCKKLQTKCGKGTGKTMCTVSNNSILIAIFTLLCTIQLLSFNF